MRPRQATELYAYLKAEPMNSPGKHPGDIIELILDFWKQKFWMYPQSFLSAQDHLTRSYILIFYIKLWVIW